MNQTCEGLTSRRVTLVDARYLIFYDFATAPMPALSQPECEEAQSEAEPQIEE
jgi:hypothetical protein